MKKNRIIEDELLDIGGNIITPKQGMIVYVNIGVTFSAIPIMQKVRVYVEPTTDTPVTAAKELRGWVGTNLDKFGYIPGKNFNPEHLYYEVYATPENTVPFAMSFNARYRREHVDGRAIDRVAGE